uniref:Uncharacterized protein n=1 Tax=Arundo donax TaxID=35708 RepID=A0A0A8YUD6_ARUDO
MNDAFLPLITRSQCLHSCEIY